ncbi:MAG: alpha-glucosidase [Promethearchaeota archaeon]|nr:MAG: alpha-glucosidase [Candidatus Lokiarchaeota archaeon]
MSEKKWWQKTNVYQIYPRSFKDSTQNGIGDLKGILNKLDYLEELGIKTIWFSPFFVSPQQDFGYDIENFRQIDPVYGTMKDFENLLNGIHKKGMKMILDMVLNHTSSKHPWFKESASSRDNPKRDWYIWEDGKKPNGKAPPNNWKSMVGGSAWKYYNNTDQWVYFHFLPFQPDLNYRNPEVKKEMFETMRFWLDKGADGFRLDILHAIYEDPDLRDNPFSWSLLPGDESTSSFFQEHKYDLNLPETKNFALELREVINEYDPPRFLVGEVFGGIEDLKKYYGPENNGLNMVFLFEFTSTKFDAEGFRNTIERIESYLPYPYTPTYVFSNHDRMRLISRLKEDVRKAKLLATLQLSLRGVPFIYYGEEIGIPNVNIKLKNSKDPIGKKFSWLPFSQIKRLGFALSRDGCRSPMQWNNEKNAGFSEESTTWLPISQEFEERNVQNELKDPNSLLNVYKSLLEIRNTHISLQEGTLNLIDMENLNYEILSYKRESSEEEIYIFLNFKEAKHKFNFPDSDSQIEVIFSTHSELTYKNSIILPKIEIQPYEGLIIKKKKN